MEGLGQPSGSLRHLQLRRSIVVLSVAILALLTAALAFRHREGIVELIPYQRPGEAHKSAISDAANATLGFEKILALSTGTKWRLDGLHAAAALTGLDIEVPTQPFTPPEIIEAFEHAAPDGTTHPSHGSAIAWIAHLDLLKHVIQSGWATALIVEDDIDWDVRLREEIMIPLVEGVRIYTEVEDGDLSTPYGGNWDVLWMGHCGEYSHDDMPYYAWPDKTVVPQDEYVGWARVDLRNRIPEGHRTTHPTTNSVCTFAYAVTAGSALKILELIGNGRGQAFDVVLSAACKAKELSCVTIHPEVFHQYLPPSEYGRTSEITAINHHEQLTEEPVIHMGTTANVKLSARCEALFGQSCQELPNPDEE